MSREPCSVCSKVISTTADPNSNEGWFVSLADAEKIECDLQARHDHMFYLRGVLKTHCNRIVLCDECKTKLTSAHTSAHKGFCSPETCGNQPATAHVDCDDPWHKTPSEKAPFSCPSCGAA